MNKLAIDDKEGLPLTRGFVQVWLDGIQFINIINIEQKFQLDGTLLSNRINNQQKNRN